MSCKEVYLVLKASPNFMLSEKPPYKAWQWDGLVPVGLPEWTNLKNPRLEKNPFRIVAMSANYHRFQLLCITIYPTEWLVLIGEGTEDERIQSFTDQFVKDNFVECSGEESKT
jgi:hypothetical protein